VTLWQEISWLRPVTLRANFESTFNEAVPELTRWVLFNRAGGVKRVAYSIHCGLCEYSP
jgi:hypothetical protein